MSFTKLPVLRHGLMTRHLDLIPDETIAVRTAIVRGMMNANNVSALVIYSNAIHNAPGCYLTNYPCYGLGRESVVVVGLDSGPFLYTTEPARNYPKVSRFTICPPEKVSPASKFVALGCAKAKELAGPDGAIGLVGTGAMPYMRSAQVEKALAGCKIVDVSSEFEVAISAKDEATLNCMKAATALARKGLQALKDKAERRAPEASNLRQLSAYVDYVLREEGAEDTNILLSAAGSEEGRAGQRVGYPDTTPLKDGDTVMAFVAVQYARAWGVAAETFKVGAFTGLEKAALDRLEEVKAGARSAVKAGMTLAEVTDAITALSKKAGVPLAKDVPLVEGIGFDMDEYPSDPEDVVKPNSVLLISLYADFRKPIGGLFVSGLLVCGERRSEWL